MTTTTETRTWAERVRAVRQARGWTQAELAQHIGCSYQTIQAWEYRQNRPIPIYRRLIEQLEKEEPR